jgi:hypothetical protein
MNLAVKCLKTGWNSTVAGIMFEALSLRAMTTSKPVHRDCYAKNYRNSKEDEGSCFTDMEITKSTIEGKLKRTLKDTMVYS